MRIAGLALIAVLATAIAAFAAPPDPGLAPGETEIVAAPCLDTPLVVDECGDTMADDLAFGGSDGIAFPAGRLTGSGSGLAFGGSRVCLAGVTISGCGGGDITSVNAGAGLTGGGPSGDVTLGADTAFLQRRVTGTCAPGLSIRAIDAAGGATCEADSQAEVRAQSDGAGAGSPQLVGSGILTVNTVSLTCPAGGGFLVISGTAFLNNNAAGTVDYVLRPKLDGVSVTAATWGAFFNAGANGAAAEKFTLDYTVAEPCAAGAHTVTQELGPSSGTSDFFYNNNHLTVVVFESGSITST